VIAANLLASADEMIESVGFWPEADVAWARGVRPNEGSLLYVYVPDVSAMHALLFDRAAGFRLEAALHVMPGRLGDADAARLGGVRQFVRSRYSGRDVGCATAGLRRQTEITQAVAQPLEKVGPEGNCAEHLAHSQIR
jgi:hypothetical protein